jgi:hypothetical protein
VRRRVPIWQQRQVGPGAWRRFGALVTLGRIATITGIVGGLLGLTTFVLSQRVVVSVSASHSADEPTGVLRANVINKSRLPVTIERANVELDGHVVGAVEWVIPTRTLAFSRLSLDDLVRSAHPLPYTLAPGESFAGGVVWTPERERSAAYERFAQMLHRHNPHGGRAQLVLHLDRGGTRHGLLHLRGDVTASGLLGPLGHASGWTTEPILSTERRSPVLGLQVGASVAAPTVVRLELWRDDGSSHAFHTQSLPMLPRVPNELRFPTLRAGDYRWALSDGTQVVAVGNFRSPCEYTVAIADNAQCSYRLIPRTDGGLQRWPIWRQATPVPEPSPAKPTDQ